MFATVLNIFAKILLVVLAYLFYVKIIKVWYVRWLYRNRGITFMSKFPVPFIGDVSEFVKRVNAQPDRPHLTKWLQEVYKDEKYPPCIGMFWPHGLELVITDHDYLQDLFQTYNEVFTKHEHAKKVFSDLFWNSVLWAKSAEPSYKPRRKIITHAFYASKLKAMSDIIF